MGDACFWIKPFPGLVGVHRGQDLDAFDGIVAMGLIWQGWGSEDRGVLWADRAIIGNPWPGFKMRQQPLRTGPQLARGLPHV